MIFQLLFLPFQTNPTESSPVSITGITAGSTDVAVGGGTDAGAADFTPLGETGAGITLEGKMSPPRKDLHEMYNPLNPTFIYLNRGIQENVIWFVSVP